MSENIIGQTILNQFRVDAFVASGGMGVVYLAEDVRRDMVYHYVHTITEVLDLALEKVAA